MKTTILAAALLALAPAAALAQNAPAPAPKANPLASLGSAAPAADGDPSLWSGLDETTRYLLIMGSADGFTAAGTSAPCFPGEDNASIDRRLKADGFASKRETDLPEALRKLSASPDKCAANVRRGYTTGLLKGMPDTHLATYLSGVVRAYASIKPCPVPNQQYAAATVIAAVFASSDGTQPSEVIAPAIVEGCRGVPK